MFFWFTMLEFIGLAAIIIYIIQTHSQTQVPFLVRFLTFITWFLSIGMILLVPLDIYFTREKNFGRDIYENEWQFLQKLYFLVYWTVFLLTWTVIPIVQGVEEAGDIRFIDKLKRSLILNGYFYLAITVAGILFLAFVVSTDLKHGNDLPTFLKSLANCWGIFLIMTLLGYSLVSIPMQHWRSRKLELWYKYLCFKAYLQVEEQKEIVYKLKKSLQEMLIFKEKIFDQDKLCQYADEGLALVPPELVTEAQQELDNHYVELTRKIEKYDEETAVRLFLQIKLTYAEVRRSRCSWYQLTKEAFLIEDVMNNRNNPKKIIESVFRHPKPGWWGEFKARLRWYWLTHWKQKFKYAYSICLGLLSIVLILSEAAIYFPKLKISIYETLLSNLIQKQTFGYATVQFITMLPLSYIIFNVYYAFFKLKISGFYGVYDEKNTDSSSLLFVSINFSRVTGPICFNFLDLIKIKHTSFQTTMGDVDLVPVFGNSTTSLFPLFLLFFALINYFDLYSKILNALGLKQFDFSEHFNDNYIDEGRKILEQKRLKAEK